MGSEGHTGASATGMVFACTICERRFARADRCPRRGSGRVFDLRIADHRDRVRRALDRVSTGIVLSRTMLVIVGAGVAAALLLGALAGLDGGAIALLIFFILLTVPYYYLRALVRTRGAVETEARSVGCSPLLPFPPAALPPGRPAIVRGVVHVRRAVQSPTGTACAAWRIVGRGPGGPPDDAAVGAFEVYGPEGGIVAAVDPEDALVDVGSLGPPQPAEVTSALGEVLRVRGDLPEGARCSISLGHLMEGDLVEVTGPATYEIMAEGLRESSELPVFRAWPTIRKVMASDP